MIMKLLLNHSVTDGLLSDDNWDICNVKEPDACTQVRESAVLLLIHHLKQ